MVGLDDFISAPGFPGAPGGPGGDGGSGQGQGQNQDNSQLKEDPGSFKDFGDDAKNAGKDIASDTAGTARNEAMTEGAALANDLIADAKQGKPPQPAAVLARAEESGKKIAHNAGEAGLDTAKDRAQAQVDKALAIIGNEFPILASILGVMSKPLIDRALSECEMPDF